MEKLFVNVTGVTPYDFDDDKGKRVSGLSVHYQEPTYQDNDYGVGFLPKKSSLPLDKFNDMCQHKFPYKAEAILSTTFTNKGIQIRIIDFKHVCGLELVETKVAVAGGKPN